MEKINTKNNFITAFWKLYGQKRIEKISIRELCEIAGYNRTTFYVYFHDIYDLLDESILTLISPIRDNIGCIQNLKSLIDFNSIENIFLAFFNENNKYIQLILKNHPHTLEDKLKEVIIPTIKEKLINQDNSSIWIDYIIQYQISAIFGVLKFWYKDSDKRISKEELAHILFEISTKGVFLMLNHNLIESQLTPSNHDKEIIENIIYDIKHRNK
ncbi:TetR/AcrR family transcriptional regulator [Paraclostridium sordellii]|uniref:TetR/AcrR family transcriptional regulator n=1 Tax=Paraclostridium sordellii TaxID=1505 RepID=UPI0005E4D44D|nr:TetR/AcrR family transcriptional regulator [Paeniclostridium sordellii]CEN87006.1 TetR family transcriptional regulator [[Clostridium] sordellii] [Paeniclostridium sordellii]